MATLKATSGGGQRVRRRFTDIGNAERFVSRHGRQLRWVQGRHWVVWDERRWRREHEEQVQALAKETAKAIWDELPRVSDPDLRLSLAAHARRSAYARAVFAMIDLARSDSGISIAQDDLDRDQHKFNCLNGTLDLHRRRLLTHNPRDLITKLAPVVYDRTATCPTWLRFLGEVMAGNQDLVDFLQRAVGYSLSGDTSEQCLFFLYGLGENGKSTFVETIRWVLGDYALHVDSSSFLMQRAETIRTDIARTASARFVSAAEIAQGRAMDEVLIKQLTGGGRVTARDLYKAPFEFTPQYKIWIEGNHKPVIRGADHAIWRRIRLVPFTITIPPGARDKELGERLRAEAAGILNWAVEGYRLWRAQGLCPPSEVVAATDQYREEMDLIGDFLSERCVLDASATCWKSDLYGAYQQWSTWRETPTLSQKAFGTSLVERGGISEGRVAGGRYWIGIDLAPHGQR